MGWTRFCKHFQGMVKELAFIVSVEASHSPTAVWRKVGEGYVEGNKASNQEGDCSCPGSISLD